VRKGINSKVSYPLACKDISSANRSYFYAQIAMLNLLLLFIINPQKYFTVFTYDVYCELLNL